MRGLERSGDARSRGLIPPGTGWPIPDAERCPTGAPAGSRRATPRAATRGSCASARPSWVSASARRTMFHVQNRPPESAGWSRRAHLHDVDTVARLALGSRGTGRGSRPHDAIARRPMRIVNPSRAINWLQTRSSHSPSSKLLLRREPEIPSPPGGPRRGRPSAADLSRSRPAALSTLAVRTRTAGPIRCNPRALGVRASCELGTELRSFGQPSPRAVLPIAPASRLSRTPGDHDTGGAIVPITSSHSP